MARKGSVKRKTTETDVRVSLDLDGQGKSAVTAGVGFLEHMLSLTAKHGLLDMKVAARGDLEVDEHHTVEDVGITLGQALAKALGTKRGIRRFAAASVPMDEALVAVSLDISGRGMLVWDLKCRGRNAGLMREFLRAFAAEGGVTLHAHQVAGRDGHHILESLFKGLGRALMEATRREPRMRGIPSTKGRL